MLRFISVCLHAMALVLSLASSAEAGGLSGDLSSDYKVDWTDVQRFVEQWLDEPACLDHPYDCADLDGDTGVDMVDFALLAENWMLRETHLVINEFVANNRTTLFDGDNESSDWIEIYNPGAKAVNLEGWYLTDNDANLTKWRFPAVEIGPGEFLIVFASDKNQLDPNELHTNFELDDDGDYLALVAPDGNTIVHEYAPEYPQQLTDISYGLMPCSETLVSAGATVYYCVPTDGTHETTWMQPDFNDLGEWQSTQTGLGFGSQSKYVRSYNDCVYRGSDQYIAPNTTTYGIGNRYTGPTSGPLIDQANGDETGVSVMLNQSGDVTWQVEPSSGGHDCAVGTDAYNTFGGITDMTGVIYYGSTGWWVDLTFTDLDPATEYTFATSAARCSYTGRFTVYTLSGAETYTNSSTTGVDILANNKVRFDTGDNFNEGYVARWTGITASEGSFTVRAESDPCSTEGFRAYSFDVFCLEGGSNVSELQDDMLGVNASLWTRIEFYLEEGESGLFDNLLMRMRYEDGFVAYLNGQEVARRNAPPSVHWNSTADANRPNENASGFESINLMPYIQLLRDGRNVLAIQGLNDSKDDGDFLILPELIAAGSIAIPQYFTIPTPGELNAGPAKGIVSEVWFSHKRGFYDAPFQLILSTEMDEAEIRYTTDGSNPTITHGLTYTNPLDVDKTTIIRAVAVRPGWESTGSVTHTYIFLPSVATQPEFPSDVPTGWAGYTADYEVDPDVVNTTQPGYSFEEALLSIPSICINMPTDDLFGANDGIYVHSTQQGDAWERPASVELILHDGRDGFQINAGVHIHGGASRQHSRTLKHSFRLVFRGIYGPTKLKFPLFADSEVTEFDQLVLRGSSGDSWSYPDEYRQGVVRHIKEKAQYTRDPWMKDTQRAMGHNSANSIFVHLYLNGLYWGQYNLCERPNSSFQASYFGGDKDEYDAIHDFDELQSGTIDVWNQMFAMATAGLASHEDYQKIQGNNPDGTRNPDYPVILNVDSLIDYMILHIFARSEDWPCHNFWAARRRGPLSEGFRFFVWDQENHNNALDRFISGCGAHIEILPGEVALSLRPGYLYAKLRENPMFRRRFADRVHRHMFNDGLLTPQRIQERWMRRAAEVDHSVVAESARWGDAQRAVPYKREVEWLAEQDWLHTVYWPQIGDIVLQRFQGVGLYPNTQAPVFQINDAYQHGGQISRADEFSIHNPNGSGDIYYTTDGNDPLLSEDFQLKGKTLVTEDAAKRVLVPSGPIDANWISDPHFDDSEWNHGIPLIPGKTGGVGYETSLGYEDYITYSVETEMVGNNTTCYVRIPFFVDACDLASFNFMSLRMRYDDGFVAYINGEKVYSVYEPSPLLWNSTTDTNGSHEAGADFEEFTISDHIDALRPGDNILAIQGLNVSTTSTDFLISVELFVSDTNSANGISPSAILYSGPIPLYESTQIKARTLDGTWSALNEATYTVGPISESLRITEIMYHPEDTGDPEDPNEEYIELKNISNSSIGLNLVRFTKGIYFTFPNLDLGAGEFVVVVRNQTAFKAAHPEFIGVVAGEYSGSLSNGGEEIELADAIGRAILSFEYDDDWYKVTDGGGFSLTIVDPCNLDLTTYERKDSWRASVYPGGSPGWDDSGIIPNPGAVVVNEVLSHSHGVAADWIELYNTTDSQIDIGGWYISDSAANLKKYKFAHGTQIDGYSYLIVWEDVNFGQFSIDPGRITGFALSENGDEVYLSSAEGETLLGYRESKDFGAALTGVSFGRYFMKSTGNTNFVPMHHITPAEKNAYPKVGPVVMSEIMYNPQSGDQRQEFVELRNISAANITLYDANEGLPWKITDGIDYTFPGYPGLTINAGGYLILAKNVAAYIDEYGMPPFGVLILGPYSGKLSNAGEEIRLSRPGDVDDEGVRHYIQVDRVKYSDGSHPGDAPGDVDLWPTGADGGGMSLTRDVLSNYGNDPNNWIATRPSPGADEAL